VRAGARLCVALLAALALLVPAPSGTGAQSGRTGKSPVYAQQPGGATPFSGARALEHVRRLVEYGPRPSGSAALESARRYILEQLPRGAAREEWTAHTPAGRVKMVNLVLDVPGETAETIIIASHYDTKRFKEFRFVGANDGGSSTGVLIELARLVAAESARRRFTYRFVFFDGEEAVCREWDECGKPGAPDNTYGSRHHVARLKARGSLRHVRALILLDMVGYEKLELGRDEMSTPWLVDIIWQTARELGYAKQFVARAESVGGDDHEPFLRAGVPAVDLIQLGTYPHWHKPGDTLDKIAPSSLKVVGDVVYASLPRLEEKLLKGVPATGGGNAGGLKPPASPRR